MTDPLPSYPQLLSRNLNSRWVPNERTMLGAFLGGGENLLPCLGRSGVSLQDVGWDLNISQGSFLFPRLCQESDSAGVFWITCPGKMGARGGWSSLSQSDWICSSNTPKRMKTGFVAGVGRYMYEDHSWWLRRCWFFTNTLLTTKSLWEFGFTMQNPYVKCIAFPQEKSVCFQICFSLVPAVNAELAHHWSLTLSETWRFASSLHDFFSFLISFCSGKSVQGSGCCGLAWQCLDCNLVCKTCIASDAEQKGREKHPSPWFLGFGLISWAAQ